MIGGLLIALLDMSRFAGRGARLAFGEVIRNTPILVQLLWVYYVLPIVFDIRIGAGWRSSACRSTGRRSSPRSTRGHPGRAQGHREAAQVLGLTPLQSFGRIVLPQAVRMTLPPLASNFVQLIKFSSLGAVISVSEITRRGMELRLDLPAARDLHLHRRGLFFICWPLAMAIRWWERRLPALIPHLPEPACPRQVDGAARRAVADTQRLVAVASPNPPSDTTERGRNRHRGAVCARSPASRSR